MVKKKLLVLGVSVAAATAVIGAGFAGWNFSDNANAETKLGVKITEATTFGELEIATDAPNTLVLDQENDVTLENAGTAKAAITATFTAATSEYTTWSADLTYTVNVYVIDALSTYVNCGTTTAEATSAKDGYTQYVLTPTTSESTVDTNTVVTITLNNPFVFVDGQKPTTFSEYQAMVAAIKSVDASTVVTETEYEVAADDAFVIIEFTVSK